MALANQVATTGTGPLRFEESALGAVAVKNHLVDTVVDGLLDRAGRMQVAGAPTGLAHALRGPGAVSCAAVPGQP